MKVIYVAGPYRANVRNWKTEVASLSDNVQHAEDASRRLWTAGWAVICPHKNSENFDNITGATDEMWLEGYLEILSRCDAIYMLRGWAQSEGARKELKAAEAHGLQILYEQ